MTAHHETCPMFGKVCDCGVETDGTDFVRTLQGRLEEVTREGQKTLGVLTDARLELEKERATRAKLAELLFALASRVVDVTDELGKAMTGKAYAPIYGRLLIEDLIEPLMRAGEAGFTAERVAELTDVSRS